MRVIDATHMEVVTLGLPWRHAVSPCSKQAISLLERNTKVVTWLMPKGGSARDQIPCILYKDRYFSLSLRMQKAIYRHIRLKKGFKNEETVNGLSKLRIPDLLLKEKIRTQSRFDVRILISMCVFFSERERSTKEESVSRVACASRRISFILITHPWRSRRCAAAHSSRRTIISSSHNNNNNCSRGRSDASGPRA